MTDGQVFIYYIVGPETAAVCSGWWAWRRIRASRAKTAWIRQIDVRHRRRPAA